MSVFLLLSLCPSQTSVKLIPCVCESSRQTDYFFFGFCNKVIEQVYTQLALAPDNLDGFGLIIGQLALFLVDLLTCNVAARPGQLNSFFMALGYDFVC